MVAVKICGIRSTAEADLAIQAGASAVGMLVGRRHASRDFIEPDEARRIAQHVASRVTPVLVTHIEDLDELQRLADAIPCPVLQLHSDLDPDALCRAREGLAPRAVIGKVSVEDGSAIDRARRIADCVDAIVLDTRDRRTDRVGGTGLVHDWSISARIVREIDIPIVLAGGLTPDNVQEAVFTVMPVAVDVHSGVETPRGTKCIETMRRFCKAASAGRGSTWRRRFPGSRSFRFRF